MGLYIAVPEAIIDLTGATILATGDVDLTADATADVTATPGSIGSLLDANLITVLPEARIEFDGTTLEAASLSANSSVTASLAFQDTADETEDTDPAADAAITLLVLDGDSTTAVEGNSVLSVAGEVRLAASSTLNLSSQADGAPDTAGGTLAVTEVQMRTATYVADSASIGALGIDDPDNVNISATLTSTVSTAATSTAGGADDGGGANRSEQRLADPNEDGNDGDRAETSDDSVGFAGAFAYTDYRPLTEAYITTSGSVATTGDINLSATATDDVSTSADGSNTGAGAGGVGVAVAIGASKVQTLAYLGGSANLAASAINVSAALNAGNS